MSIQAVGWVLKHERETKGTTRLVLIALANYADDNGEAWPSVPTLAVDCNCSERAVQYALEQLVDMGLVSRELQAAARIRRDKRPNVYRLSTGVQDLHPAPSTGCKPRQSGVQTATERGEAGFTQSITRTINEPSSAAFAAKPPMDDLRAAMKSSRKRKKEAA